MNKWMALSIAIGLLLMSRKKYNELLGLKLNNPGNIKEIHKDHNDWVGEHPLDLNSTFEEVISPEYGIRALGKLLGNYYTRNGLDTVEKIITKYAPASDSNPTRAYVTNVAARLGLATNEQFSVPARLNELVKAVIHQEQGYIPYSDDFIQYSIGLTA